VIALAVLLVAAMACPVTKPNGIQAPNAEYDAGPSSHGNEKLSAGPFGIPPAGTITFRPGGPGFITRGGSLGMKFGWLTAVSGPFTVTGRRLDAPAPAMWADNATGQVVAPGFHATALVFPTPGCWEVTGRVGDASLTFAVSVEKVGDGPAWRRDELP
jgi:hypothetical protein